MGTPRAECCCKPALPRQWCPHIYNVRHTRPHNVVIKLEWKASEKRETETQRETHRERAEGVPCTVIVEACCLTEIKVRCGKLADISAKVTTHAVGHTKQKFDSAKRLKVDDATRRDATRRRTTCRVMELTARRAIPTKSLTTKVSYADPSRALLGSM